MPDTKITALTALTAADPANDVLPIVDVSDTTMAASGTTKKISINNVLGCSGTATLASATITGNLTVDTNTLFVDAANNRVGVGTATPNWLLTASGSSPEFVMIDSGANGTRLYTKTTNTAVFIGANYSTSSVPINFTLDGGSSNSMTLNSTGLGVGTSPSYNLDVRAAAATANVQSSTGTNAVSIVARNTGGSFTLGKENSVGGGSGVFGQDAYASVLWSTGAYPLVFGTNAAQRMMIDSTGNVGIGVTPKSWASGYRALQLGIYSALTDSQGGATFLTNNAYFDSVDSRWEYITNNRVVRYDQDTADGGHKWYSAAAGAVNAAITWGNPLMTLDTNGNLILQSPSTPPTLTTNGQLTVNATSNTNLRFSYRGSDGVTRVANITLA